MSFLGLHEYHWMTKYLSMEFFTFSVYQSPPESLQYLTITHTSYIGFPALLLSNAFHYCFSCRDDMGWLDAVSGLLLCSYLRTEQGCKENSIFFLFRIIEE